MGKSPLVNIGDIYLQMVCFPLSSYSFAGGLNRLDGKLLDEGLEGGQHVGSKLRPHAGRRWNDFT